MTEQLFWGQKTFCLITGASRGIGKTIGIQFAQKVGPGSLFVLVSRSTSALEETKGEILANNKDISVHVGSMDLEQLTDKTGYHDLISTALKENGSSPQDFGHSILVHNAGSLGNENTLLKVTQLQDGDEISKYWSLNLTSVIILTSQFCKIFHDSR
jgi:short-subunit dehydrogenase